MITEKSYLDIEKSLSKGSVVLVAKKEFDYYSDMIISIMVLTGLGFGLTLFGLECFKNPGLPDKIFSIILFISSAISLFGVYRKITQNKFLIIDHSLSGSKVRKIIINYFDEVTRNNIDENGDSIVIKKYFSYYYRLYSFISIDGKLYINIRNFNHKGGHMPVIFGHFFLKNDLQKLIKNS